MLRSIRQRLAVATAGALLVSAGLAGTAFGLNLATNDNFANATVISPGSLPYFNEVNASGATSEVGEVSSIRCDTDLDTIWYKITPNFNGALRADTIGMDAGELVVYTGSALGSLTEIACNDGDATDDTDSARVTFKVKAGTTYRIQLSDVSDDTILHLRRVNRPANDDFSHARSVGSLPLRDDTSVMNATFQYNEPDSAGIGTDGCATADPTIWYTIRPGSNMVLRASVFGAIDTVLAVYRGTSLGSLTPIGCNDDTSVEGQGLASNVAWRARAGVRYYIQVGGYEGETGPVRVSIARGNPPANDNFGSAQSIVADANISHHIATTRDATMQLNKDEPDPSNCSMGGSVWYKFVAPASLTYVVDTAATEYDTTVAVYTGSSLSALTPVENDCDPDALLFAATMGTVYYIQIGGNEGDSGELHMRLYPD